MRLKKFGLVAVLAVSASVATAGAAYATTSYPDGGTWNYETNIFVTGGPVFSNYYHPSQRHGSTAVNGQGGSDRSADRPGGTWSYASTPGTWWGNSAYYRVG
jgi:lactococcin 972 family bacteriocin